MDTHDNPDAPSLDLDDTLAHNDDNRSIKSNASSRSSNKSFRSTSSIKTITPRQIDIYQRRITANAKNCKECRELSYFPADFSDRKFHVTQVLQHWGKCKTIDKKKRPASDCPSNASPAVKQRTMNPPETITVPKKPQTNTAPKPIELPNSDTDQFASAYGSGSDSAKTHPNISCPETTLEKNANEFQDLESHTEEMEVQSTYEKSPDMRKHAGIREFLGRNSPEAETTANVTTNNRFEVLTDLNEDRNQENASTSTAQPKKAPNKTPPPIVMVGNVKGDITIALDRVTTGQYWVKYTANTVVLHTKLSQDYEAALRALNAENIPYHTYAKEGKKTHAFVLRGMAKHHTAEDILKYLKMYNTVNAQKCFAMKTLGVPLFLVITDTQWNINKLNKEVTRILRAAVTWENRKSNNPITQCRRCQTWGHSQLNCRRTIRCSKCAGNHLVQDCAHQGKPVCANCKGEHRAFSTQCPVYEAKISQYYERFPAAKQQKPQYVPAPPPANPAWKQTTMQTMTSQAPPPRSAQAGPSYQTATSYSQNFPTTPAERRRPQAVAQQPAQTQYAPATANATDPASQFHALRGKFDELNSMINLDAMLQALDIYLNMLRSAKSNDDLFMLSREFFCNVLPSIKLSP